MSIELRPDVEALIEKDVQRGPYRSAAEFVEQAVQLLHAREEWLAAHRDNIAAHIETAYLAVECGEFAGENEVRAALARKKREWLDRQTGE